MASTIDRMRTRIQTIRTSVSAQLARLRTAAVAAAVGVQQPTVREFLLVAWNDVGARMSGIFSVPFGALAVFADSSKAQLIWALLAASALLLGAYRVWAKERDRVRELTEAMAPKLSLEFDGAAYPYHYDVRVEDSSGPIPAMMPASTYRCYRARVTNVGHTNFVTCKAQVKRAWNDRQEMLVNIPFSLRQSFSETESFPLRIGEENFIDVLAVPLSGPAMQWSAKLAQYEEPWPTVGVRASLPMTGAIIPLEHSTIQVQVLSEGSPPEIITLRFENSPDGFVLRKA